MSHGKRRKRNRPKAVKTPAKAAKTVKAAPAKKAAAPAKAVKKAVPAKAAKPAAAPLPAKAEKPAKPAKPAKEAKPEKLVRDSFTIPRGEYTLLQDLKLRASTLGRPAKKSEVLRAGIQALKSLDDAALLAVLGQVPVIKTGRPTRD
ncbi:hypothetical protein GT347_10275 [Xylophilus rhododendri]|uniref:Uncharacterized protein n=1 Tax=Xylophilus rhododendri TaxID=2697032 RepID=A0A857J336_9BURK|nr:hypothetical protein [Xylophilus rhododendri]QHI98344.1 hypothetical protein GT347_10275 [Xylophilus rhododendri]